MIAMQEGGIFGVHGRTVRERIAEDRRFLLEILITAVVFGLSLNIVANGLWELPRILESMNL